MDVINEYTQIRKHSEEICAPLQIEDYVVQIVPFASPAKWHLAHTTWFFEVFVLTKFVNNYTEFNKEYNYLFNSYYNNVGDQFLRANRGNITRPTVNDIYKYRAYVDEQMLIFLAGNSDVDITQLIILGLNHEQQHQELLMSDIKYMFGHNPLFPVYDTRFNLVGDKNYTLDSVSIKAGVYEIGHKKKTFCYDNELGVHKVYLDKFSLSNSLVTNREYIEFIEDGAYSNFNLWLDEGWAWLQGNEIKAPLYWHKKDGVWYYYTLSGLQKVDLDAITCHISFFEANAFAQWKNTRLPTEFEWEVASNKLDWGKRWEWTNSAYLPYPNFEKAKGAVGEYNGKFMSSQMVLRGASEATAEKHSRNTYRNFFHPQERWQFTGIRLIN